MADRSAIGRHRSRDSGRSWIARIAGGPSRAGSRAISRSLLVMLLVTCAHGAEGCAPPGSR
eukprot:13231612-Alexandrium_andersonii.AAC.1